GVYRDNRHLSLERADAVARYLIEKCGVSDSKLAVIGFGQFDPRIDGNSDSAKQRNRRVEIVVGEKL
ncbi:MAG: OmpA family protein, partial [Planctomycetes bacterium]|nr:OmpA family protein [Planctomycetota bacterium]